MLRRDFKNFVPVLLCIYREIFLLELLSWDLTIRTVGPPHDPSEPFTYMGPPRPIGSGLGVCTHRMSWTIASMVNFFNVNPLKLVGHRSRD